jgi:AcrR family transcriptional regulator
MSSRRPTKRSRLAPKEPVPRPGQEGGKRDLNRKHRVASLLDAALPLFLAHGIDGVSIDDIVAAAGIAKGSYYRYFVDKADLVRALLAPVVLGVESAFAACEVELAAAKSPGDLRAAYDGLAGALAGVFIQAPAPIRLYLQEGRAPATASRVPVTELGRQISSGAVRLTEVAHARHLLRAMDARLSATAVIGAIECVLFGVLTGEAFGDVTAIVPSLITLVLDGLRTRPGADVHGALSRPPATSLSHARTRRPS